MSPEYFSDALNYLDDDLIEQTDALRQGRRVLHRPKVTRWLVPAACLALVLGALAVPAMNGGSKAMMDGYMENAPEYSLQDSMNSSTTRQPGEDCDCAETVEVLEVSGGGMTLYIPENWTCTHESREDGSFYLVIRNPNAQGAIRVGWVPFFGVCGTGLETEKAVIAGMEASVGYYDGRSAWSFITFQGEWDGYVVINDGADGWLDAAMEMLESIVIEKT